MRVDRVDRWVVDLTAALDQAEALATRGREAFDTDPALPLAFEALATRVGEIAKRLIAADPVRFTADIWRQAARNRDFVVHHYDRVDRAVVWRTIVVSFPALREDLRRISVEESETR